MAEVKEKIKTEDESSQHGDDPYYDPFSPESNVIRKNEMKEEFYDLYESDNSLHFDDFLIKPEKDDISDFAISSKREGHCEVGPCFKEVIHTHFWMKRHEIVAQVEGWGPSRHLPQRHGTQGKVTEDGRVNGGLNLSRALGDHAYKLNTALPAPAQMITALPDVRRLALTRPDDEFMVLACDGIWNFMSSQEVCDFVRPRIAENNKLSAICEEVFDHCLAPDTMGDGTGCDNMTCVIVTFPPSTTAPAVAAGSAPKRPASPSCPLEADAKRTKTEDPAPETTSSVAPETTAEPCDE